MKVANFEKKIKHNPSLQSVVFQVAERVSRSMNWLKMGNQDLSSFGFYRAIAMNHNQFTKDMKEEMQYLMNVDIT